MGNLLNPFQFGSGGGGPVLITNYAKTSEQFNYQYGWNYQMQFADRFPNYAVAPDGKKTASLHTPQADYWTGIGTSFYGPSAGNTAGDRIILSGFFKMPVDSSNDSGFDETFPLIDIGGYFGSESSRVDLRDGSVVSTGANSVVTYSEYYGSGWWRLVNVYTFQDGIGNGSLYTGFRFRDSSGSTPGGAVGTGVLLWGLQIEYDPTGTRLTAGRYVANNTQTPTGSFTEGSAVTLDESLAFVNPDVFPQTNAMAISDTDATLDGGSAITEEVCGPGKTDITPGKIGQYCQKVTGGGSAYNGWIYVINLTPGKRYLFSFYTQLNTALLHKVRSWGDVVQTPDTQYSTPANGSYRYHEYPVVVDPSGDGSVSVAIWPNWNDPNKSIYIDGFSIIPQPFEEEYENVLIEALDLGYQLPSESEQINQNNILFELKSRGIWSELDVFYYWKGDGDWDFKTINWKNPTGGKAVGELSSSHPTDEFGLTGLGVHDAYRLAGDYVNLTQNDGIVLWDLVDAGNESAIANLLRSSTIRSVQLRASNTIHYFGDQNTISDFNKLGISAILGNTSGEILCYNENETNPFDTDTGNVFDLPPDGTNNEIFVYDTFTKGWIRNTGINASVLHISSISNKT